MNCSTANWSGLAGNTVVGVNQTVNLTCSDPEMYWNSRTTWKKNGIDLELDASGTGDRRLQKSTGMYLYIENTTLSDTAIYECIFNAPNNVKLSREQNLTVTKTPAVTINSVEPLKDLDQVILNWSVNKSIFVPEFYKIERATENDTFLYPDEINKDDIEKTIDVPNNQTAYSFRILAFAGNKTHISNYSEWIIAAPEKSAYISSKE